MFRALASSSDGCCYRYGGSNPPLLIDAGIAFQAIQRGLGFTLSEVAGCLVSHAHGDHCRAVPYLMAAGVDCYASLGTWQALSHPDRKNRVLRSHRAHTLEPKKPTWVGPWTVTAFEAVHDAPGTLGFVIDGEDEKLLYLTDSAYSLYKFEGLTIIAIECNYSSDIIRQNTAEGSVDRSRFARTTHTHMSLERLVTMLKANDLSKCHQIHLLHLSDENSDEVRFKETIQKATGVPVFVAPKLVAP